MAVFNLARRCIVIVRNKKKEISDNGRNKKSKETKIYPQLLYNSTILILTTSAKYLNIKRSSIVGSYRKDDC